MVRKQKKKKKKKERFDQDGSWKTRLAESPVGVTACVDTKLCSMLSVFPGRAAPFINRAPRGLRPKKTGTKLPFYLDVVC